MITKITDESLIKQWNQEHPEHYIGTVVSDRFKKLHRDLVQFPNGKYGSYYVEENAQGTEFSGTHIIPVYHDCVLLEKAFRYPVNGYTLEFPRGTMDPNESIESTAVRELYEEIGAKSTAVHRLGTIFEEPAKGNSTAVIFAIDVDSYSTCQDDNENIDAIIEVQMDHVADILVNSGNLPALGVWAVYQNWLKSNKNN